MTDFLTVATAEQAVALAGDALGPPWRPPA
jgi:hypothetical protein